VEPLRALLRGSRKSVVWRLDKLLPFYTTVRHYPTFLEFVHRAVDTLRVNTARPRLSPDDGLLSSCVGAVEKLRSFYQTEVPPFSLQSFLDHFGVAEVRERLLDRDARLILEGGRLVIEVNVLFPKVRRRLSVAHEIAHMVVNECANRGKLCPSRNDPKEESLCNRLAGDLLVPAWALRSHLQQAPDLLLQEENLIRCSTVLSAASAFGVSVDVISRRIFQDLKLAPRRIAIIWRERENFQNRSSERGLRICSVWRSPATPGFIPLNKTAPCDSVITEAFQKGGTLFKEEEITLGGLSGRFSVEAAAFGYRSWPGSRIPSRAILSLLSQTSHLRAAA
jgi:hypothetical protein